MNKILTILSLIMIVAICSCSEDDRNKLVGTDTGGTNPPVVIDTGTVVNPPVIDTGTVATWEQQFEFDYARGDLSGYAITDVVCIGENINPIQAGNSFGDIGVLATRIDEGWMWEADITKFSYKINGHDVGWCNSIKPGHTNDPIRATIVTSENGRKKVAQFHINYSGIPMLQQALVHEYGWKIIGDYVFFGTGEYYRFKEMYKNLQFYIDNNFMSTSDFYSYNRTTVKIKITLKNISTVVQLTFWSGH